MHHQPRGVSTTERCCKGKISGLAWPEDPAWQSVRRGPHTHTHTHTQLGAAECRVHVIKRSIHAIESFERECTFERRMGLHVLTDTRVTGPVTH